MTALEALIGDLEAAVQDGHQDKRVTLLRQVTDLFIDSSQELSTNQVDVFGDVLTHLIKEVEDKVLAELGAKLAPIANAPNAVIQKLARHDEIMVAAPVLTQSTILSDNDLIEIAQTKSQRHLGAISERANLTENVTDVLVERGDAVVVHKLASNDGAAFSSSGFDVMAKRAETDENLAEQLGGRIDLPSSVLQQLMEKATETVRQRLKERGLGTDVQNVIAAASRQILRKVAPQRNYRRAEGLIAEMAANKKLNEEALADFAKSNRYEETVVGLARLCSAPIELIAPLMQSSSYEGLLVACKSAGFEWPTLRVILAHRGRPMSKSDLETARADFAKLALATAQRVFRFWLVRGVAKRSH